MKKKSTGEITDALTSATTSSRLGKTKVAEVPKEDLMNEPFVARVPAMKRYRWFAMFFLVIGLYFFCPRPFRASESILSEVAPPDQAWGRIFVNLESQQEYIDWAGQGDRIGLMPNEVADVTVFFSTDLAGEVITVTGLDGGDFVGGTDEFGNPRPLPPFIVAEDGSVSFSFQNSDVPGALQLSFMDGGTEPLALQFYTYDTSDWENNPTTINGNPQTSPFDPPPVE